MHLQIDKDVPIHHNTIGYVNIFLDLCLHLLQDFFLMYDIASQFRSDLTQLHFMSYIENGGFLLVVLPSSSEMVKTLKSILNFMKDNRKIRLN